MRKMSNINMPFCPWIPDHDGVPGVCPGHDKKTQGVVIKYVHAVVFHTGGDTPAGLAPGDEALSCRVVSVDHCEKRLFASIS